ncbi:hypothetical protein [Sphingomonas sp.]|uniref:hypothetical protein n=1 Tax=Sphingomonas sp. TaxID=28214 RepID=UPI000DB13B32|nr:hypothetical protein [Sphingomonas sp.]PZU09110.1 MAG: hypothetical protein DI605_10050 [Sphingomonas sp.]
MKNSATDIMQEILFSAVMEAVAALKTASKGMPNSLLRDINAMGPNTAFADLPKEVQASIAATVRTAFNRLLKEGYSVAPTATAAPARPAGPRPDGPRGPRPDGPRGPRPSGPRSDRPRGPRPPSDGPRPASPGGRTGPRRPQR